MKCAREHCTRHAKVTPVFKLRTIYSPVAADAAINLPLCQLHASEIDVDFITPELWASICEQIRKTGHHAPERSLTTVVFRKLQVPS